MCLPKLQLVAIAIAANLIGEGNVTLAVTLVVEKQTRLQLRKICGRSRRPFFGGQLRQQVDDTRGGRDRGQMNQRFFPEERALRQSIALMCSWPSSEVLGSLRFLCVHGRY